MSLDRSGGVERALTCAAPYLAGLAATYAALSVLLWLAGEVGGWLWTRRWPSAGAGDALAVLATPARGAHSGQAAIAWWDSLERGLPRLAEEFRSCRQGSCRRVRDVRPGWVEAFAGGDVAHAVIEEMLRSDWQGWFPSWPRADEDPAAEAGG
ncbi:MAG: hypothetical protein E6J41_10110 [Chloroflexi bacterium]|nr:MAG: hypothetical protein E6J41_10110 [Chloroflexota bacterium]